MRLAKTFLFVLPLSLALINPAAANIVFNLQLAAGESPIIDVETPSLTRTINVFAFEDSAANGGAFTLSSITLTRVLPNGSVDPAPDADFTFTNNVPLVGPAPFGHFTTVTSPGSMIGTITATAASTATYLDAASIRFDTVVANYFNGNGARQSNIVGVSAVPEPGTFGLLAMGSMGLTMLRRRRS